MNQQLEARTKINPQDWKNFLSTRLQVTEPDGAICCQYVAQAMPEGFDLAANLALFSRNYYFVLDHPDDCWLDPSYVPHHLAELSEAQMMHHRRSHYRQWWEKELQKMWAAYNNVELEASRWFGMEFETQVLTWSERSVRSHQTWQNPMGIALKVA